MPQRERETERERQTERETEREREFGVRKNKKEILEKRDKYKKKETEVYKGKTNRER